MSPRLTALAALAVLCACATKKDAARPEGPLVKSVEIEGTRQLDDGDVKDRILTTETAFLAKVPLIQLLPFVPEKQYFDPNAWQADLRRVERFYMAEGYYQAKVVGEEVRPDGDGVAAVIRVEEGEPTRITRVTLRGLEDLPEEHREEVLDDLPVAEGDIFREASWAGVKGLIQGRLKQLGYAEAEVGGEVAVDVARRTAEIDLAATPGERFRFGVIFVATDANPKVPQRRIVEQASGAIEKGDWYSELSLSEAQARVFQMGVFGGVKVTRGAPDRSTGTVPVVVDVREAPFHSLRAGGGFGMDVTRQEVRAVAEYTDRNWFGSLRRLNTRVRAGYAAIPDAAELFSGGQNHGPIFNARVEVEQPRFFLRDLRAATSIELERGLEPAYTFIGGRGKFGVVWQPHPNFSIFPSYNLEIYNLGSGATTGDFFGGNAPPIAFGCRTQPCVLSYLEQTIEWDRRDDRADPKRGFYTALSLQEGGGPFASFTYLRVVPDARAYVSFLENKLTVAGKVRLGTLITRGESPIIARFFSGGANNMRGFGSRRLAPYTVIGRPVNRDRPIEACFPDDKDVQIGRVGCYGEIVPIGGNSMVETSVEARYQAFRSISFAVFLDSGLVKRAQLRPSDLADLHHAVGVGVRLKTPVGPIRVDLATRIAGPRLELLASEFAHEPQNSCFGIGRFRYGYPGYPEGLCSFHLSIGEAF